MDLDELRNKWHSMTVNPAVLEEDNRRIAAELARGKVKGAQQKLADFHIRNSAKGFILPVLAVMLVTVLKIPVLLAVVYALFGLIMGIANIRLGLSIRRTDYAGLPVVNAFSAIIRIRRRLTRIRIFGITVAVIILLSLASEILGMNDTGLFIAFLAGIVLGIPVAILIFRKSSRLVDDLQSQLRACISQTGSPGSPDSAQF